MKKVTYDICKNKTNGNWALWKNVEEELKGSGGISFDCLMVGSRKECKEKLEEIKKNERQRKNKNARK